MEHQHDPYFVMGDQAGLLDYLQRLVRPHDGIAILFII
jgi:hypothetical protein